MAIRFAPYNRATQQDTGSIATARAADMQANAQAAALRQKNILGGSALAMEYDKHSGGELSGAMKDWWKGFKGDTADMSDAEKVAHMEDMGASGITEGVMEAGEDLSGGTAGYGGGTTPGTLNLGDTGVSDTPMIDTLHSDLGMGKVGGAVGPAEMAGNELMTGGMQPPPAEIAGGMDAAGKTLGTAGNVLGGVSALASGDPAAMAKEAVAQGLSFIPGYGWALSGALRLLG